MTKLAGTWIRQHAPELKGKILATLSMEGCISELSGDAREANVKGGLGVYFGDKLEGLHAIGMDRAFGCMPLYSKRLVQSIRAGRQHIEYKDVSYDDQPIRYVRSAGEHPLRFDVWGWNEEDTSQERPYRVHVYSIRRGGTLLYLFHCPPVFDILYPDELTHPGRGPGHRFLQETVFAECVYELLRSLHITPDILHLNEGHVADAAALVKSDPAFDRTAVIYTNHTVVPAGLERFNVDHLVGGDVARARYAMRFPKTSWQRLWRKFAVEEDGHLLIDFSRGALQICDVANGVSAEHAEVTARLFGCRDKKIEPVLNGSGDTWVMDELVQAERNDEYVDANALARIGRRGKLRALAEVQRRTAGMTDRHGQVICPDGIELDPDKPTVWMVRRMVEYKSQLPILRDIVPVICADRDEHVETRWGKVRGLGMQIVVGGIAPLGSAEENWIEQFIDWIQRPELQGRFAYVPNSDSVLLKMQAIGADICINCPQPQKEACGTSDQRTARNGGLNIATRSGGPPEYIEDGRGGALVGPYTDSEDFYARAPKDVLDKLRQMSDLYYGPRADHECWQDAKLQSYRSGSHVTAKAMEQRYTHLYVRALRARWSLPLKTYHPDLSTPPAEHLDVVTKLQEAASHFLYRDPALNGWTVIAGSQYFDRVRPQRDYNRARDTLIALPGLCLERERYDRFKDVMKTYLRFVTNGVLANAIGDGSAPICDSVDASLWLFWAIGKYLDRTHDYAFLNETIERPPSHGSTATIRRILEEIVDAYRNGIDLDYRANGDGGLRKTHVGIADDGLLFAGHKDTQLTWMDARLNGCGPVAGRHGKAVEVNALWYNALTVMEGICEHEGRADQTYAQLARKVRASFGVFWNDQAGCLYDTVDGDPEQGHKVRPNQVFAVALGLLDSTQSRAVMDTVRQELLTPAGLRTLSPYDPDYLAGCDSEYARYQGAAWCWLMGGFIEGCLVAYGRAITLRILDGIGYLSALSQMLERFGSIPETTDGLSIQVRHADSKEPCTSHACGVAESLRGLSLVLSTRDDVSVTQEKAPATGLIYEMILRDYCDPDNNVVGLNAASQELPFLAESGVEYVYLLGLMKHTGRPFDILDPFDVDPRAGTFADLDHFLSVAHELELKVIADWLANQHVSKDSPLCTRHPDWFLYTDAHNGDYYTEAHMQLHRGRDVDTTSPNLVLVSATDEVPMRAFPRRWSSLAQPDLSHPGLRDHAIRIGRFWLAKGLDGFRIDAALSTFPDKIRENWRLTVQDNLTRLFINEMRRIRSDCFILFEGFERLEELVDLADSRHCAVYNWRPRNFATAAIRNARETSPLTSYLAQLQQAQAIHKHLANIGPEHDAMDFEDPWAQLDARQRLLLYFTYNFLPGYTLISNGQVFGANHRYKTDPAETRPAPKVADADPVQKEIGKRLFNLRRRFPQLTGGRFQVLETHEPGLIGLARYDARDIVIGVVNTTAGAREAMLDLSELLTDLPHTFNVPDTHYMQDVVLLSNDTNGWVAERRDDLTARTLFTEGLYVGVDPKSCQLVRLRACVRSPELPIPIVETDPVRATAHQLSTA